MRNHRNTRMSSALSSSPSHATDGVPIKTVLDRLYPQGGLGRDQAAQHLERRVTAPRESRQLSLAPQSWNPEARTVDVVWTTGARGARFSWEIADLVDEELATAPANVRLDRLNRGAPVLNSHQAGNLSGQIGTVVPGSARMANGQGIATIQLSARDDLAPIVADIAAGIIRNLSVGYTVHAFEVDPKARPRPLYRAIDWEPTEISFVAVPFDAGAQVRSLPSDAAPCIIRTIEKENIVMSWLHRFTGTRAAPAPAAAPLPAATNPAEISYERQASVQWLRNYTRTAADIYGLPQELVHELTLEMAERSLSEGEARDATMQIIGARQRQETGGMRGMPGIPVVGTPAANALIYDGARTYENPAFYSRAIEDALYARMAGTAPTDEARTFMNMGMVQIAAELATRAGVRDATRMAPMDVLNAAAWNSGGGRRSYMRSDTATSGAGLHTTSDFPELLLGAGERYLLTVFQAVASPLKQISRQRNARDFRAISGLQLGGFGVLPEVLEGGEIKHGTFKERKESYRLKTFAKQFGLSRQAIINDDLGAFSDPIRILAGVSAETEAQLLADLLNNNPALSDGIPLFDARHGNLGAVGAPPSIETLDAGRKAMRSQKDSDNRTPVVSSPKFIVSGIDQETRIEQLMTTLQVATAGEANPFAGKLTPACDPRLDPAAWYLFGDPATAPTLEHAYLDDQVGPKVEMQDGWDVLGTKFRVYLDFGAGVVDHRGAYKNTGK